MRLTMNFRNGGFNDPSTADEIFYDFVLEIENVF
jgi:hypothetical protein